MVLVRAGHMPPGPARKSRRSEERRPAAEHLLGAAQPPDGTTTGVGVGLAPSATTGEGVETVWTWPGQAAQAEALASAKASASEAAVM
jgi:hypothetical protein